MSRREYWLESIGQSFCDADAWEAFNALSQEQKRGIE